MTKKVVAYIRVSTEEQNFDGTVSISQQRNNITELCNRNNWTILDWFEDSIDYIATHKPQAGKRVNPSATRIDRPAFIQMLELVKTGRVDAIVCSHDDRLYRHERVVTAIKDALEEGEALRGGQEIEIYQTSGIITKNFMYLQAMIWRMENERRVERTREGKKGTLKEGRWPGTYWRYGYKAIKEPGKRGRQILLDLDEVPLVQYMFDLADQGETLSEIRKKLIDEDVPQKRQISTSKHKWNNSTILNILRSPEYYTGKLTWNFEDGSSESIDIPTIISPEQWKRVQKKIDERKNNSKRNTKGVYLLQGLLYCGECKRKCGVTALRYTYKKLADGTRKRYEKKEPWHQYFCRTVNMFPDEPHSTHWRWSGTKLEEKIWRYLVDNAIQNQDVFLNQVRTRRAKLQQERETIDSDIVKAQERLIEIDNEQAEYARLLAEKKINEHVFDIAMAPSEQKRSDIQAELERLLELKAETMQIDAGMDDAKLFLEKLQERLPRLDIDSKTLKSLSPQEQRDILTERQQIIAALCDKIEVFADEKAVIHGVLDESEVSQIVYINPRATNDSEIGPRLRGQ